ncbi:MULTISPECIES: hypothetical protein [Bacillus cereus group]|uniref:hypothetical protein n=1 Tax=Bacillus cereus group TaxID=86661 RepID=UPI000BF3EEB6|nr:MULTISPECIES: hypothetical protein [Bacillus cereus group]PGA25347.1 hypothetical protein COL80_15785 [Bacillus thuringiensis]PGU82141.1 hypothetical protein COD76_11650 [Bacillus cereus]
MPFNKDDYTRPPFTNGAMFTAEETDLIKRVQGELQKIAEDLGIQGLTDPVIYGYNTYPERWDKGEWINGDTASQCWSYQLVEEFNPEPPAGQSKEGTRTQEEVVTLAADKEMVSKEEGAVVEEGGAK